MKIKKRKLAGLIALALVLGTTHSGSAAQTKESKPDLSKTPITIEADKLYFSDGTGKFSAEGNVIVLQNQDKIKSNLIQGDTNKTEIWVEDKMTLEQPGVTIDGYSGKYNYQARTGSIEKATGKVGHEFVKGNQIEIYPKEVVIHDGSMTKCPAELPDYKVTAEKVEIWPGEKLIAYNAKFWIKNMVIFSLPKYQKSLKDEGPSEFPRVGYYSGDGFFLSQHLEYPIGNAVSVYTDQAYYSKTGYKPVYGVTNSGKNYNAKIVQGYFRDGDGVWVEKEPEFSISHSQRIGKSPIRYSVGAVYGKWTDDTKSSWHQDYSVYFSHDKITLGKGLTFNVGTGIQKVFESYNDSQQTLFRYNLGINKVWSPQITTFAAYNHTTNNNKTIFDFDRIDVSKELVTGFSYKLDKKNTLGFSQSYDLENSRVYEQYYTWQRNLHCWEATFTYKAKEHKLTWEINTARW